MVILRDELKFYWDVKTASSSGNPWKKNNHMTPLFHKIVGGNCHFIMTLDQKCKRLCFIGWFCHSVRRIFLFPADFSAIKLPRKDLQGSLSDAVT